MDVKNPPPRRSSTVLRVRGKSGRDCSVDFIGDEPELENPGISTHECSIPHSYVGFPLRIPFCQSSPRLYSSSHREMFLYILDSKKYSLCLYHSCIYDIVYNRE